MALRVKINDTGIPYGVKDIAEQLPDVNSVHVGDEIILEFSPDEFVYMTGLVMIATWRKSFPEGVIFRVDDSRCTQYTQSFLTNIGFREIIETGHEMPSMVRRMGRIPLQPLTNQFSKEATVNGITEIFAEFAGQVLDTSPFNTLLSELCENALAHSEMVSPSYVCARASEKNNKVEIAIADSGIGMRESFLRGTNQSAKERIRRGASSIEIGLDGLNSSKPTAPPGSFRSYYGFGLLITRRLVEENHGQMTIISGNEMLSLDRNYRKQVYLESPWQGTFVGIVLDLTYPLPLERIYEEATNLIVPSQQSAEQEVGILQSVQVDNLSIPTHFLEVPISERTRIEIRHYGTELLTRDAGVAIRADIASHIAAGSSISINLDGITDITPSVADEAFGKLAEIMGLGQFQLKVGFEGGEAVVNRLVEFVIKTRTHGSLKSV